jgi:hypothetical protein
VGSWTLAQIRETVFRNRGTRQIVQHYCTELIGRELIEVSNAAEVGELPEYVITAPGRQYVQNMDR